MTTPFPPVQPPHPAVPLESLDARPPAVPPFDPRPVGPWPPPPAQPKGSKKHLFFGAGGLLIGLVAGLLLGAIGSSATGESVPGSAGESATGNTKPISAAVLKCELQNADGVTVMDDGASLEIKTAGKESSGVGIADLACVLGDLKTPQSVIARMESTRALDGTQTGTWAEFTASWTYHPDRGLNVVIEAAN